MVSSLKLLRERGLSPKKSFGQNFLQDAALCRRIAELAAPEGTRTVLEIGAGLGALTEPLLERVERVIAIERDRDLLPLLEERLGAMPGLSLVEADAVRVSWAELLAMGPEPRTVAGNLPYQLTGRLLRRIVEHVDGIAGAVVMVQREVADRLVAEPGTKTYGALSVFVQAAFRVERAILVAPGAFAPQPKVGSAVVVLAPAVRARETALFREVVQKAFAQRRKTLRNAWKGIAEAEAIERAAEAAGVDLGTRGETLRVEDFAAVAAALESAQQPREATPHDSD